MRLFHKDVFLPAPITATYVGRKYSIRATRHAQEAALNDRYGKIEIPASIEVSNIIEAEVTNNRVSKLVVRQSYDATRDLVLVFIPEGNVAVLKTSWFNLKTDRHSTLKRHLYATAL